MRNQKGEIKNEHDISFSFLIYDLPSLIPHGPSGATTTTSIN